MGKSTFTAGKDVLDLFESVGTAYDATPSKLKHIIDLYIAFALSTALIIQDLSPEQAFADFVFCNLVLYLVVMYFLG